MCKFELKHDLYKIADEIIKEIIEPVTGKVGIFYDPWLADIEMFTLDDELWNEAVFNKIQEKYSLSDTDMLGLDSYQTLIEVALYIYLGDERPQYPEMEF